MNKLLEKMISNAHQALALSYSPYSNCKVASCIQTDTGNLYTGTNIENGSYSLTLCAEACALCNMITAGEKNIKSMVILSADNKLCPPCGACRQRIYEFSNPQTIIHLCNKDSVLQSLTINELLPLAFDFKDHN